MCYRFSSLFVHAVHGMHDINRLCTLSVQKARQRLDRKTQILLSRSGKIIRGKQAETLWV
jgi:hypothetical protein